MISEIDAQKFASPICAIPGDRVIVTHHNSSRGSVKSIHEVTEAVRWTVSIMFKLNGDWQFMIGDEKTLAWLEAQS